MKYLIIIVSTLAINITAPAQLSKVEFSEYDVVFFGIDFTASKMIGSIGFENPQVIVDKYFELWNGLLYAEQHKFNVAKGLNVKEVKYDLDPVKVHNRTVDPTELVVNKSYRLDAEGVQKVISSLDMSLSQYTEGQGFIFVVESFDKTKKRSFVWCTVFDIATKQVTATEVYSSPVKGYGLRNYWGNSFKYILNALKKATR